MKLSLVFVLLFVSVLSFSQKKPGKQKFVKITGNVTNDTKGFNKVFAYGATNDTAIIKNGKFTFSIPYSEPHIQLFYDEYEVKVNRMYKPFGILLDEPCNIMIRDIDLGKGLQSGKLSGSKTAELYQEFNNRQTETYKKISAAFQPPAGPDKKAINMNVVTPVEGSKRDSVSKQMMAALYSDFIRQYPDEFTSVFVLSGGRSSMSLANLEACYNMLSDNMKKTNEGQNIVDYIHGAKNSVAGKMVENFVLPDPDGKDIDFNSMKGKYVLLDFWASWCGPCKQSFPYMREMYKTYKNDNFEIYSISIDKDKAAWLKGVALEKNPWPQSLDTKNISQKGFAVTGVPTYFLIDPQGKILMKELGFEPGGPVYKMLAQIFGKSVPVVKPEPESPKPAIRDTTRVKNGVPMMRIIPGTK